MRARFDFSVDCIARIDPNAFPQYDPPESSLSRMNPVPGPPMGANTRLSFRYRLQGAETIRVQIYSLSNGYHRQLILAGLTQSAWQSATVDMTTARRPDGSGGPLAADERIDDLQFYVVPEPSC